VTETRRFRCEPESVPAARRFVRDVLRDQAGEIVDAAELMACELATNCVRHAHTDFELVIRSHSQIRVEVRDTGRGRPVLRSPTPHEPSGRGLRIVEAMSSTWGVIPSPKGKTVWFTLPQQPRGSSEPSQSADSSDLKREGNAQPAKRRSRRAAPGRARRTPKAAAV
jgi:anti-sigma regulatory factor (Ser/Thr protein kinase)